MVKHAGRAPGGGPRRRIRTKVESVGRTMKLVRRNASKKPIPANWRALYAQFLLGLCETVPPQLRTRYRIGSSTITPPAITIPAGSRSDSCLVAVLSSWPELRRQQAALMEFALRTSDVLTWPVPATKITRGKGRTTQIATSLPAKTENVFMGTVRHYLYPLKLAEVGIDPDHIVVYFIRRGWTEYLGIRTSCDRSVCSCGRLLESNWHLAWEMHY